MYRSLKFSLNLSLLFLNILHRQIFAIKSALDTILETNDYDSNFMDMTKHALAPLTVNNETYGYDHKNDHDTAYAEQKEMRKEGLNRVIYTIPAECYTAVQEKGWGWWAEKTPDEQYIFEDADQVFMHHVRPYLPELQELIPELAKRNWREDDILSLKRDENRIKTGNSFLNWTIKILDIGPGLGLYNAMIWQHYQMQFYYIKQARPEIFDKSDSLKVEIHLLDQDSPSAKDDAYFDSVGIDRLTIARHLMKFYDPERDDKENNDAGTKSKNLFYGDLACSVGCLLASGVAMDSVKSIVIPNEFGGKEDSVDENGVVAKNIATQNSYSSSMQKFAIDFARLFEPSPTKLKNESDSDNTNNSKRNATNLQYDVIFSARGLGWGIPLEQGDYGDIILRRLKPNTGRFFFLARCRFQSIAYLESRTEEDYSKLFENHGKSLNQFSKSSGGKVRRVTRIKSAKVGKRDASKKQATREAVIKSTQSNSINSNNLKRQLQCTQRSHTAGPAVSCRVAEVPINRDTRKFFEINVDQWDSKRNLAVKVVQNITMDGIKPFKTNIRFSDCLLSPFKAVEQFYMCAESKICSDEEIYNFFGNGDLGEVT